MINKKTFLYATSAAAAVCLNATAAEIPTNTAQMQAMDKITGRVSVINVPVNSEVRFGSFSIIVRDCRTRPPEETPENFAFVDVADTIGNNTQVNIFKGWMLSSSPALNAVEHPVYDVWLLKCIDTDLSNVAFLSAEELAARDNLPMQRVENRVKVQEETVSDGGFEDINLSGEPIDLLPAAVREAGDESAAAADVVLQQPVTVMESSDLPPVGEEEKTEAPFADVTAVLPGGDNVGTENPAATDEENAPHSLLRINDNAVPENAVKSNIEIKINEADDNENEIVSDAQIVDTSLTKAGENQDVYSNSPTADEAKPEENILTTAPASTTANEEIVADQPLPAISADTLRELEEELSRNWN